ncbi:MAG: hypothetical protein AUK48_13315 [Oscillatoriales cyanobacterium CG2_30_44_21]|nr:MAG: hypothetical protein AUK48_13315 [Oscillatoriales cyanobacterium CG2_30_44_21]
MVLQRFAFEPKKPLKTLQSKVFNGFFNVDDLHKPKPNMKALLRNAFMFGLGILIIFTARR